MCPGIKGAGMEEKRIKQKRRKLQWKSQRFIGSFLCLLNNNSGYDILELSFIPGGYNDAGITHIA